MIRAVLFDLDGVLIDAAPWHYEALNMALSMHGYTPIALNDHKHEFDGLPTRRKLDLLISRGLVRGEDVENICALKQKYTREKIAEKAKFDPTIFCVLAGLVHADIRVGIVSNAISETIWQVVKRLDIEFAIHTVTSNEDAVYHKPDPYPYLLACKRIHLKPEECLAVEDGQYGIQSAEAAGCSVMRVSGPSEVTPARIWKALC